MGSEQEFDPLTHLAIQYGADKGGGHRYTPDYHRPLHSWRDKTFDLLEIGVGGNEDPRVGGRSLRMWKASFPKARISSIDIQDKGALREERIPILPCDQSDPRFLPEVAGRIGGIGLITDDGRHINKHVVLSFRCLFPHLEDGGIYVVEDLHASYWSKFGGDSFNLNRHGTSSRSTSFAICCSSPKARTTKSMRTSRKESSARESSGTQSRG